MNGIQKTVYDGLQYLATKIADGFYGEGDEALQQDDDASAGCSNRDAFLDDLQDEVIDKMD